MRIQVVCKNEGIGNDDVLTAMDEFDSMRQNYLNKMASIGVLVMGHYLYIGATQYKIVEVNVDIDHCVLFVYVEFIKD